jgi:pyruvate dehydrogenase E1 component
MGSQLSNTASPRSGPEQDRRLLCLEQLERKVLWLATWTVHHANHLREKRDRLKVGGHQASSASVATLMTALYFDVLRPQDRVAVKPHASPVFHAIQYLFGRQSRERLERFRAFEGAQAYPSRTKDADDVDFSTGSVGLGPAMTSFASVVQEYVELKKMSTAPPGRMVAVVGDAELDEGNVYEALLEGWKHGLRNAWWVVDYNRQSLDAMVEDRLFGHIDNLFRDLGWRVEMLKHGRLLEEAFKRPGGSALREWIDVCPNDLYAALAYQGGTAWRQQLDMDLANVAGIRELLDEHTDDGLARLMTNLGGHDLGVVLDAFNRSKSDQPTCFIAYTIKGYGLPLAGHRDNHAGLLSVDQLDAFRESLGIRRGEEWSLAGGLEIEEEELRQFISEVPFAEDVERRHGAPRVEVPQSWGLSASPNTSTQHGFGRLLGEIARSHQELADHVVTTSPDVTVSTGLGSWVNRRGVFSRSPRGDVFREKKVATPQSWERSPKGQHIELGIAENNLFLVLAALGLADSLYGARLLPIGTLYDPFIGRGLDALNYALYQGARFLLIGTPSGVTLSPEGGAHQSVYTPLIGMGQPGWTSFEPAFVDELGEIFRWSLEQIQADDGGAVYLRLSTRPVDQPSRELTPHMKADILAGAYWYVEPSPGSEMAIVCSGAITPEAINAHSMLVEDIPEIGLLVVTSHDRLHREWLARRRLGRESTLAHVERLLSVLAPDAGLITVLDGHPATLSWLGAVAGHRVVPLGVETFGQSGDLVDLYRVHGIDVDAIIDAAARLCLDRASIDGYPR